MHTGRLYRRVNPPWWFPNVNPIIPLFGYQSPAAQWIVSIGFIYAGKLYFTDPNARGRVADIQMKEGFIEWAGDSDTDAGRIGFRFRFQLQQHKPYYLISLRVVDNVGSFMQADWHVTQDQFHTGPTDWRWDGLPVKIQTLGFFEQLWGFSLRPVHYNEEP